MKKNVFYLEDKKEAKKKNIFWQRYKYFFIVIILLIVIVSYYYIHLNPFDIIEARYGQIIDGFETDAIVIREETIVTSPVTGKIFLAQQEGKRVRYGETTVKIDEQKIFNHQPGIISYQVDGLEYKISPDNIYNFSFDKLNNLRVNTNELENEQYIFKGEPLYRIIDNKKLFLTCKTSRKKADNFQTNESVFVGHKEIRGNIRAVIKDIFIKNEQALITLKLDHFIKDWINIRRVEIELIKNIYNGLIIPRAAVVKHQENFGVYTLGRDGNHEFKKIKVEDSTEDKVVVTGISTGEQVIANPEVIP